MSEVTRADRAKAIASYMRAKRDKEKKKKDSGKSMYDSLFGDRIKKLTAGSKKDR